MFIVQNVTTQMNTGEIDGTVHDALGGAVPGAAVTIKHAASGLTRERTSDLAGRFLFSEVPIGEYVLSIERKRSMNAVLNRHKRSFRPEPGGVGWRRTGLGRTWRH